MSGVKKSVLTAMFISLGIVLPMLFHMIPAGWGGRALLPMHIPVLLSGLVVGPFYGFFAGLITPLLSSMATGMPPAGLVVYRMMIELSIYGFVSGLLMRYIRTKRALLDMYISLVVAMLAGRAMAGLAQAAFFFDGVYAVGIWVTGYFATSIPGIIIQIIIIPHIITVLERARLIPLRYPKTENRKSPACTAGNIKERGAFK